VAVSIPLGRLTEKVYVLAGSIHLGKHIETTLRAEANTLHGRRIEIASALAVCIHRIKLTEAMSLAVDNMTAGKIVVMEPRFA